MTAKGGGTSSLVASLARKAQENAEKSEQQSGQRFNQKSALKNGQRVGRQNTRKGEQPNAQKAEHKSEQKNESVGTQQKARNTRKTLPKALPKTLPKALPKALPGQAKRQTRQAPQEEKKSFRGTRILAGVLSSLKKFLLIVTTVSLCVLFLGGIGMGFLWLYREATSNEFFATERVDVVGNVRMSQKMVLDLAGVREGDNSLSVSIAHVEQALMQTPWVEEVSVKRILPDRFVIHIKERMPSFWVRRDGVLHYADVKGNVIAPVETKNFVSLPTLEVEEGMEGDVVKLGVYLNDLKSGKFPVDYDAISALRLSEAKGMELYLDDREMRLCIALKGWKDNLMRMSVTLGDLARRNELSRVQEIRSADGNVWVMQNI